MVNIKVAVRIRPLTRRESLLGEDVIVRTENKTVVVTNPKIPERQDGDSRQRTQKFAVDFCYDSTDADGCSQEAVYKEIGLEVLNSMLEGYNACILAYGHSASGKTYTIMGTQDDPGLTPRLCRGLFEKLDETQFKERIRADIIVSFLEIYNEKVRDLLGSEETTPTGCNFSLRVREHPKLGPYVQGLSEHLVTDKRKLLELLTTGNRRRSTAVTENNEHSSRSHAMFTIQFKLCDGENFETEKSSKVHLVDLAGSEKASCSQSKERLKEGANINKSLVTLGNVVSALAESCESGALLKAQSTSKSWHPFVPYRDSVLTWLLKDTLGGNSNTIMIATISPAGSCLGETLNTLRYAKRTKRIVNQPVVNEDPKIRTIRQLRQEIARLKRLLISYQSCGSCSEFEETNFEEITLFSIPESKWLDFGGTNITNKEGHRKEIRKRKTFTEEEDQNESSNGIKYFREAKEPNEFQDGRSSLTKDWEEGVLGQRAALSETNACKISDEKKSDVNGSVNDNFSHETQIFSDSLESFSSSSPKSGNACEVSHDGSGLLGTVKNACEIRETSAEKFSPRLTQDFSSSENLELKKKKIPGMLHRSRPDLIRGISSRSKEGPPSGSSQSCTDVSNLSQSTSENSLNSSGSVDVLPLKKNKSQGQEEKKEASLSAPKKTEKRSEIVEAVTSRLYVAKKKPNRPEGIVKQQTEEEERLEELKLCKRARMKLFDLSRKLAMTRKIKKTVDNDTQTDNMTATLRVKEKCVTTEPREASGIEQFGIPEEIYKDEKPCLIMNQVFIPRESNYVVECGKVVRVETPEVAEKRESATQTVSEDRICKNANTSPVKFNNCDEDSFSEDSLDLEDKCKVIRNQETLDSDQKLTFNWPPDSDVYFSCDSEERFREKSKAKRETFKNNLRNEWPLIFFSEKNTFHDKDAYENYSEEWRKEENLSSENSYTSVDGTDASCSSETSSEDFVFYESFKDKDSVPKTKPRDNRELYTITENSEPSDTSDAFSPIQNLSSSLNVPQKIESGNSQDRRRERKTPKERKMLDDGSMNPKGEENKNEFMESKRVSADKKFERKNSAQDNGKTFTTFMETSRYNKAHVENKEVPKPTSFSTTESSLKIPDRVPRSAEDSGTGNKTDIKHSHSTGFRCQLRSAKENKEKQSNSWTDFQSNSQKQFLNLSIPSSNTATSPAFSVDTHLFGKASKEDDSADAIFNSSDSITFVFMGPAKPKTSVLMEIVRRSLGKTFSFSDESPRIQRKSRSRGVQCDATLVRSVSVDSAMIALSRISKNQEPCSGFRRTASLRAFGPEETPAVLSRRKNNFHCSLKVENSERENRKSVLKNTVPESNNEGEKIKNEKKEKAESIKKSVSWFRETKHEVKEEREAPDFDLNRRDSSELEGEHSNERHFSGLSHERRVRFLKRTESPGLAGIKTNLESSIEPVGPLDPLKAFLKEATRLLKQINFFSSKYTELSYETVDESDFEENQTVEKDHHVIEQNGFLNTPDLAVAKSKTEGWKNLEKNASFRSRTDDAVVKLGAGNLTWPRMRSAPGKHSTTETKTTKFPVSLLPSRSDSFHVDDIFRNGRKESSAPSWNPSNITVESCRDESPRCGWVEDHCSLSTAPSRSNTSIPKFNSISELETDIEESCRRLVMAAERDRMREKISNGQTSSDWFRKKKELWCRAATENEKKEDKYQWGKMDGKMVKRRKPEKCAGSCVCRTSTADPCKHLWSKSCRSSFELDSFGPGSSHCHQHCMFCRKKDAEIYYSALSLNSKCSSDFCRLNYYGFCPCSSVRLSHVAPSPRAYMQSLLALRRRIVNQTKRE